MWQSHYEDFILFLFFSSDSSFHSLTGFADVSFSLHFPLFNFNSFLILVPHAWWMKGVLTEIIRLLVKLHSLVRHLLEGNVHITNDALLCVFTFDRKEMKFPLVTMTFHKLVFIYLQNVFKDQRTVQKRLSVKKDM